MPARLILPLLFLLLTGSGLARAGEATVYAAASLGGSLRELAGRWESAHPGDSIRLSAAASSTLARQIEAGAPADLYASADRQWMDYLAERRLIQPASRRELLGNSLVLIAPAGRPLTVAMRHGQPPRFEGRLCLADPSGVPAGIYGRQALQALDWWPALAARLVATLDVRAALAFVERGECALGVVYGSDALGSPRVVLAGRFPESSHEPVVYPFALLPGASATAQGFYRFLQGPEALAVFRQAGFTTPMP